MFLEQGLELPVVPRELRWENTGRECSPLLLAEQLPPIHTPVIPLSQRVKTKARESSALLLHMDMVRAHTPTLMGRVRPLKRLAGLLFLEVEVEAPILLLPHLLLHLLHLRLAILCPKPQLSWDFPEWQISPSWSVRTQKALWWTFGTKSLA